MNIYDIPFLYRLTFLLFLMGIYAFYDFRCNPENPTKWKEYGFFFVCGIIGSIIGVINDGITSNISIDYFVLGKGIQAGEKFHFRVTQLGAQAGFIAGGIAGAVYLIANNKKPYYPSLTYQQLFYMMMLTILKIMHHKDFRQYIKKKAQKNCFKYKIGKPASSVGAAAFLCILL